MFQTFPQNGTWIESFITPVNQLAYVREKPTTISNYIFTIVAPLSALVAYDQAYNANGKNWLPIRFGENNKGWVRSDVVKISGKDEPLILSVPFFSQYGPGSSNFTNDCGPACAASLIEMTMIARGFPGYITVDIISSLINKTKTALTGLEQLRRVLKMFAIECYTKTDTRPEPYFESIRNNKPVIILFDYGLIPREDVNYTKGHFVVLVGVGGTKVVIHDPGHNRSPFMGRNKQIPIETFNRMLRETPFSGLTPGQSLFLR